MTVIVAALTGDGVVMACDGETTAGWEKQYRDVPKIWTADQFVLGSAGCVRTAQVVKHHVTWPKYRPAEDDGDFEAYLVKTVVPAIRAGVKDRGVVRAELGIETLHCSLLLAVNGRLAAISGNGCVVSESAGRMAIGSGSGEALGRLGDQGPWTADDVVDAVRRAIQSARGCAGPISVVSTTDLQVRTVNA